VGTVNRKRKKRQQGLLGGKKKVERGFGASEGEKNKGSTLKRRAREKRKADSGATGRCRGKKKGGGLEGKQTAAYGPANNGEDGGEVANEIWQKKEGGYGKGGKENEHTGQKKTQTSYSNGHAGIESKTESIRRNGFRTSTIS